MRATVDTNIWVSAVISSLGPPARLEAAFRAGRFILVTSPPLLEEVTGVLLRPRLARRYGVTSERIADIIDLMRDRAESVEVTGSIHVCRDADDDAVLETAVLGNVDVVVSGDKDVLADPEAVRLLAEHGIEVWTVRQFVDWLEAEESGGAS
ncbi:MAG: putative toxin-antitoxin system toxin component, PIN family [Dehalococcoidia bacterium]